MDRLEVGYKMINSCKNCVHSDDVGVDEMVLECVLLNDTIVEVDGICKEYAKDDRESW